jgi:hypothetical protein
MKNHGLTIPITAVCVWLAGFAGAAFAQPEVMAWGNLTGIRVDGYLLELNSSMCIAQPGLESIFRTGREKQTNSYTRNGKIETITVQMRAPREARDAEGNGWAINGKEVVEDTGAGAAKVDVEYTAQEEANIAGAYFCMDLPADIYSGSRMELINPVAPAPAMTSLAPGVKDQNEYVNGKASGVRFITARRQIEVMFSEPTEVIVRDDRRTNNFDLQVLLGVATGKLAAATPVKKSFALKVTGEVDKNPVEFAIDATKPGQVFDGLGGNFRLQNAGTDPQVIQYSLDNVRIAWGRVEMPWQLWDPAEDGNALETARAGKANPRVLAAMEMAQKLAKKGMPVIVSAWQAPQWAILGASGRGGGGFGGGAGAPGAAGAGRGAPGGIAGAAPGAPGAVGAQGAAGRGVPGAPGAPGAAAPGRGAAGAAAARPAGGGGSGNPLNPAKMARIKQSIADYLVFLKEKYGVEATMFTFNESDLGINVRQTAREHAEMIKTFGSHFAARGLATKLALGDTSDARPIDFIKPAMKDPEAVKYIGAVDFHSWRGCTDEILAQWYAAARELNVPLIVGEGSTDAAAWRYPQIFFEQSFALYEIDLYTRIMALAQPKSILQWQFTADYSVLAGGGIFGDNGPLRPTQRYWNLKQLSTTPPRSFHMPVKCARPGITCAALGNAAEGVYTLHVVNNGGSRPATITGLPADVKQLRIWVTDKQRGMQEGPRVAVTGGKAQFTLDATSFVTLISAQ